MSRLSIGIGAPMMLALLLTLGVMVSGAGTAQAAPQYSYGCDDCHRMPPWDSGTAKKDPFTGGVPGNHQGHSTADTSSCVGCHTDVVTGYSNAHRNKVIEIDESLNYSRKVAGVFLNQTSVPPNPLGTCSNISCHSDGKGVYIRTAAWGSSPAEMDCSSCHGAVPNTGKHTGKHAAYYGSGTGSCDKCHANHLNDPKPFSHATSVGKRALEVKFVVLPNVGGGFDGVDCSNLYCHSDGRGNPKRVAWAAGTTLDCSGCHGNATSTGTDALSAPHATHVNNTGRLGSNYGCADCHSSVVSNDAAIFDTTKHVDGSTQMLGSQLGQVDNGSCATSYCHSDGKGHFKTVAWTEGAATPGCNACHGTSPSGVPSYANGTAGAADANSHGKHLSACVDCHSKTTVNGTTIIAGSQHTDGFNNYTAGNGKTFGKLANKTCSNISCHSGNGVVKNVAPAQWGALLDCSGCHLTLTSGHAPHTDQYGCVDCHSGTVSSNTVILNQAMHLSNAAEVAGAKVAYTLADKSCATSCHMSGVPKWSDPVTGTCDSCHAATSPLIATDAHAVHFAGTAKGPGMALEIASCQICHEYTGVRGTQHADGTKNMRPGYPASGACSTCHKQTSTVWTATSVSCESCHSTDVAELSVIGGITAADKASAASSGHGKTGIALGCVACHDKDSAHISGAPNDNNRLLPAFIGSANTECNACHSDPDKVSALNLNIKTHRASGPGTLCSDCHDAHGTAPNTMMVSRIIDGTPVSFTGNNTFVNDGRTGVCQVCHITSPYFNRAGQQTAHVDSTSNCLECHSHNPVSGFAFQASGACDACHGYPPAPRQTISAISFGVQGSWSSARFEDYSGGGGAHMVEAHVRKDLRLTGTDDDWTPCLPCHFDGKNAHNRTLPTRDYVENVNVKMDPQYRFSADYQMVYSSAKLLSGAANKSGTCFNTSCHMRPSLKWSTER